jgi:hypothetical protein
MANEFIIRKGFISKSASTVQSDIFVSGDTTSSTFIKIGGLGDDVLLDDGTTTPLSALTGTTLSEPNTVFVDANAGDDQTGTYEDPSLPFLTINAAITALPADDGSVKFIRLKGDLTIDTTLPNRKLYFISNEANILTINVVGDAYNNSGGTYNELFFIMPFSEFAHNLGNFQMNKTKLILDVNEYDQSDGSLNNSVPAFNDCEEIQADINSINHNRRSLFNIENTGETNTPNNIHLNNIEFVPLNSTNSVTSNFQTNLTVDRIELGGVQAFTLANGSIDIIFNGGSIRHTGTSFIRPLQQPDGRRIVTFNSVPELRNVIFAANLDWGQTIITGFVDKWDNSGTAAATFSALNLLLTIVV